MPPTPKVPRRVSTRGGVHLVGIVVFMLPGLMVALTQGVTWLMGRTFATGDVGTGYGIAMLICATGAVVLGWKGAGRNRAARGAFEAASKLLDVPVSRASYLGDIALLGVIDGVQLELALTLEGKGKRLALVGSTATPRPPKQRIWGLAPASGVPPFGTPELPPGEPDLCEGGWQGWGVEAGFSKPFQGLPFVDLGGAHDELGLRVLAWQAPCPEELGTEDLVELAQVAVALHKCIA